MLKAKTQTQFLGWTVEAEAKEITMGQVTNAVVATGEKNPVSILESQRSLCKFCSTLDITPQVAIQILKAIIDLPSSITHITHFDPTPSVGNKVTPTSIFANKSNTTPTPPQKKPTTKGKYEIHGTASLA